jgi:hypothetical protein
MPPETPPHIRELLERICDPREKVYEAALEEAKLLPEPELFALLMEARNKQTLVDQKQKPNPFSLVSCSALLILFPLAFLPLNETLRIAVLISLVLTFFVLLLSLMFVKEPYGGLRKMYTLIPAKITYPPMAEVVFYYCDLQIRSGRTTKYFYWEEAHTCLKEALPLINREVAERIPQERLYFLYSVLVSPYDDTELTFRVLNALPLFADPAALGHVAPLTQEGKATPNMERVSSAARICYKRLQVAIEERKQNNLLLRPSSANVDEAQALLRPSEENSEDKRDLLRPPTD